MRPRALKQAEFPFFAFPRAIGYVHLESRDGEARRLKARSPLSFHSCFVFQPRLAAAASGGLYVHQQLRVRVGKKGTSSFVLSCV